MFEVLLRELKFKTSRSNGPGGQHVNKVETRVELVFNLSESGNLNSEQKETILRKLRNRISNEGVLRIQCDETRSQSTNKEIVSERFLSMINDALKPEKERKPTKPGKASKEKRLKNKKKQSEKKDYRKPFSED